MRSLGIVPLLFEIRQHDSEGLKAYPNIPFKDIRMVHLSLQWLALSNQASFHYLTISHCLTARLVVFISKGNNSQETFPFKSDKYSKYLIEQGHGGVEFSVLHLGLATGGHCQVCLVSLDLIHLYFWGNTKIYFKGDLTTLNKMWICWIILSFLFIIIWHNSTNLCTWFKMRQDNA